MNDLTKIPAEQKRMYVIEVYRPDAPRQLLVVKASSRKELMIFGPLGNLQEGEVDGFRILWEREWGTCIAGVMFDSTWPSVVELQKR